MNRSALSFLAAAPAFVCAFLVANAAHAHVAIASGPAFAGGTQEVTFGVGHGCSGADTQSVKIDIPTSVTSVRAENSNLGKATVTVDAGTQLVSAVTWTKADADLLPTDANYYKLTIRIKVPSTPFTTVYFTAHQTCKVPGGATTVVDWVGTTANAGEDAGVEPAPALVILPARQPGWNKFTIPAGITIPDVSAYFADATIVWKNNTAAYSANSATVDQIKATSGVTALTSLAANDVVWVKY